MRKIVLIILFCFVFWTYADVRTIESDSSQTDKIELTIYNQNIGLVKDVRKLEVPQGTVELKLIDVSESIMPESVNLNIKQNNEDIEILEQIYEFDLADRNNLLEKYEGKEIKLVTFDKDNNP
ncbi:MAG: hypothetical protein ACOC5T_00005, partial [Elusimicrobiota bacterium]